MTKGEAILLVDDDRRLCAGLREYLSRHGFRTSTVSTGRQGLAALDQQHFGALVLDLMLPDIDGLEVCRRIRGDDRHAQLPILMLTARGDDVDKIVGLELGADDYLAKPFNPRELLARLRALLRRAATAQPPTSTIALRSPGLVIDLTARAVRKCDIEIALTQYEFDLLAILARAPGRVFSREQLIDALRGRAYNVFDRSVDVHISHLRAKLEDNPKSPRVIKTIRGIGYVLIP